MSLLLLTVTLRGVSNKHCLLPLFSLLYFLIGSSSFLQVTRTAIKAWMSSNLGRIPPLTSELVALERLKKCHIILLAL